MPSVAALVVTYNRKSLLIRCLTAILGQNRRPDKILIVDNASSDGTRDLLRSEGWLARDRVELLALPDNIGGAGGFSAGLKQAIGDGADWVWMMDDDAEPHPSALSELMSVATNPAHIFGSIAVSGRSTSWPLYGINGRQYSTVGSLPESFPVSSLPFLGFLVSARVVSRIGYPDANYFIAGDDHEYCLRAAAHGVPIVACGRSFIDHPPSRHYRFGFGPFRPTCFYVQPWKRYYDVRNRITSAFRHDGLISTYTKTVPGTLIRWLATLLHEPDRLAQTRAYCSGLFDGIAGRGGRRHERWGL